MLLITGGAGFIGSNIIMALSGRTPIALCDWLGSDDKWKNIRHAVVDDFVAPEGLEAWLMSRGAELTGIIHMGAISATTERNVDLIVRTNLILSRRLWDFATEKEIPFIYASSAATYGDGSLGFDDRSDDAYLSALRPLNAYGWSKLAFDRQVLSLIAQGKPAPPKWAGLKFFNVYGPYEGHKGSMRSVMSSNFDPLMNGETLRLFRSDRSDYPDGGQKRDFVYVGDCVRAILWMLDNPFPGDIYNIGTGSAQTWLDVAHAMFAALNQKPRIEFIEMPAVLKGRYQYWTEAKMEKLGTIGYNCIPTPLVDGVAHAYAVLKKEADLI